VWVESKPRGDAVIAAESIVHSSVLVAAKPWGRISEVLVLEGKNSKQELRRTLHTVSEVW
jgi:hypothetical protein